MTRILQIVSSLSKNAGIISMLMNYFREIDRSKFIFDFIYFKEANDDIHYREEINELGGRYYLIPKLSLTNGKIVNLEIKRIFDEYKYETVHCHEAILINFIQKQLRDCGAKRLIAHSHSASLSNTTVGLIRNRLMTIGMNRHCDDLAACSELAGIYLFGDKEFTKRGTIIINGVDTSKYLFDEELRIKTRKKYGISNDTFVLGTVGRCEAIKNQSFILDLLANEQIKEQNICFILIGEGPLFEDLKQKAAEKDVRLNVIFAGSQKDIRPFLCAMDMFLFPSRNEGFGVALVEAQLCKLPCIANDTIPRETGISNYVHYISTANQDKWIQTIMTEILSDGYSREDREFDSTYIDIRRCARRLEEFYSHG